VCDGVTVAATNDAPVEPQGPRRCAPSWQWTASATRPSSLMGPDGARRRNRRRAQQRARRATRALTVRVVVAVAATNNAPVEPQGPRRCTPSRQWTAAATRPSSQMGPDGARRRGRRRDQQRARRASRAPTVRAVVAVAAPDVAFTEPRRSRLCAPSWPSTASTRRP